MVQTQGGMLGPLGGLHILHSGAGVRLTVVESDEAAIQAMCPQTWPQPSITLSSPAVPFYIPPMDGRR